MMISKFVGLSLCFRMNEGPPPEANIWLFELSNDKGVVFAIRYNGEVVIQQPDVLPSEFASFLLLVRKHIQEALHNDSTAGGGIVG